MSGAIQFATYEATHFATLWKSIARDRRAYSLCFCMRVTSCAFKVNLIWFGTKSPDLPLRRPKAGISAAQPYCVANCGDEPIPGVTLSLVDGNNTGSSRYDDYRLERCVHRATTTTDSNGVFSFGGVPTGEYIVVETNETGFGFVDVTDTDGSENPIASYFRGRHHW